MGNPTNLLPCPLCGGTSGYVLAPGSTYRWWAMSCADCGRQISECASDRRTSWDACLPTQWHYADLEWNEAAEHANQLRDQVSALTDRVTALEGMVRDLAELSVKDTQREQCQR